MREETKLNEKRAYLYISHVSRGDSGIYGCLATNAHGHSIAFLELRVQEPPDRPVDLRALEVGSRSVTLTWALSYGGNAPISSYVVQYRDSRAPVDELLLNGGTSDNDILPAAGEDRAASPSNTGNYYRTDLLPC